MVKQTRKILIGLMLSASVCNLNAAGCAVDLPQNCTDGLQCNDPTDQTESLDTVQDSILKTLAIY